MSRPLPSRYIFNGQIHKYIMNSTHAYRMGTALILLYIQNLTDRSSLLLLLSHSLATHEKNLENFISKRIPKKKCFEIEKCFQDLIKISWGLIRDQITHWQPHEERVQLPLRWFAREQIKGNLPHKKERW